MFRRTGLALLAGFLLPAAVLGQDAIESAMSAAPESVSAEDGCRHEKASQKGTHEAMLSCICPQIRS